MIGYSLRDLKINKSGKLEVGMVGVYVDGDYQKFVKITELVVSKLRESEIIGKPVTDLELKQILGQTKDQVTQEKIDKCIEYLKSKGFKIEVDK